MGNVDQFRWLSRGDMQRQMAMARDELGVRLIRVCAMYSPELGVWTDDLEDWRLPEAERPKRTNWQMVDLNIEALLELGLKPVYTTCFTPAGMTDDPTVCWPDKNRTGMPRDLDQWKAFVAGGIRHHIERYGIEEVKSWYFECWNEPNLKGCFFGGTKEDFFRLWSATWHAVKSVDPELRFGGPSTARGEWIPEFLDFVEQDGTPPDYLVTHVYNNDSEGEPLSPFDGPASHKVKDSPHFASGVVKGVTKLIKDRNFTGEVHWNEWGRSWFPMDPSKETALEAAFIVKTMAEVSQEGDFFAFWCLSDIYNQCGYSSSEFQGNYGMLSLHGLRKPAWFAHMLLEKLGTQSVPVAGGDSLTGAIATSGPDGQRILVYAYPENPGAEPQTQEISLALPGQAKDIRLYRIGSDENNILAQWRAMGAPPYPTREQIVQLHEQNSLLPAPVSEMQIQGNIAIFSLERPGVALLEID
jgi:xylan 1,4-beta-xylosidase